MNEELLLHELVRWENYNEYEGHCLATWHDRVACFADRWDETAGGPSSVVAKCPTKKKRARWRKDGGQP
jgi:hypothetical protein